VQKVVALRRRRRTITCRGFKMRLTPPVIVLVTCAQQDVSSGEMSSLDASSLLLKDLPLKDGDDIIVES